MSKPVRHTAHEMRNAAELAKRLGVAVRLEPDGAIVFVPDIHKPGSAERIDEPKDIRL